jgi:hypothetical protein
MRMTGAAVVAVGLAVAGLGAQQQIQVFASIVDGGGASPATLEPADVRLVEGAADLKVARIEPVTGWPTRLQVLIDNGAGTGGENLQHLRNGLRGLLEALPDGIEVSVYTTAPQPRPIVRPTTDKALMLKGVDLLAPDGGVGRFVESLNEALQRIERDKSDHFPMIVTVGSAVGDTNVMDRDIERIQKRIIARPPTIHVAILNSVGRNAGGAVQGEVGMAVAKMTGGRFESIAAASRMATLMPEYGTLVAASHEKQSRQFRITAERTSSGPPGSISIASRSGLKVTGLSFDGRHP